MPPSSKRDLFLQVDGSVDPLRASLKAGRSVLVEFGAAAGDTAAQVQEAFKKLGGGSVEQTARTIDAAYARTFANIRANAQAVANATSGKAAFQIINSAGAEQAAAAAETQAAGLRVVADAATRAAAATQGDATAARVYATAAQSAALGAEEHATAMRAQATVLAGVRTQLGVTADAEDELGGAHRRSGASGLILDHVMRSLSDSIAAGQSPVRALSMELPRLSEAAQLVAMSTGETEGALGKFAAFMSGGWGVAITVGTTVLGPLLLKLIETGNAADEEAEKLKKNAADTETTRLAKQRFATTLEGVHAAILEQADALGKESEAEKTAAERANDAARANLNREITIRKATSALLEQALAQEQVQRTAATAPGERGDLAAIGLAGASARVAGIQAQLAQNNSDVQTAMRNLIGTKVDLAGEAAKIAVNPMERIKKLYDDQADAAKAAARVQAKAGKDVTDALSAQLIQIEKNRKAENEAEQAREQAARRAKSDEQQSGRQITTAQATDIIHGIGGTVTSTYRSPQQQAQLYDRYQAYQQGRGPWAPLAAKPGTSEHETGQAADVAKTAGMTLAKLVEAFRAAGVRLTEKLDEGDHFHVAWGAKGPSSDALQRRQQATVVKGADDDKAFASEYAGAQSRIMAIEAELTGTAEARLQVELDRIATAKAARYREIADEETAGKIDQVQAVALRIAANNEASAQSTLAKNKTRAATLDQQLADERQAASGAIDLKQLQLSLATTTKARRDLALQILALARQDALAVQQKILNDPTASDAAKGQARTAIGLINEQYPAKQAQVAQQYQNPLQQYGHQLHENVDDMGTALDGVAKDGLQHVEDGLTGLITGTMKAKEAFRQMAASIISDLVRIAIEKAIVSFIPGLSSGGPVTGFLSGGLIEGFDGGGHVRGPGTGTSDSILGFVGGGRPIKVSNGEFIVNAAMTRKHGELIKAINGDKLMAFAEGGLVGSIPSGMPGLSQADMRAIRQPSGPATYVAHVYAKDAVLTETVKDWVRDGMQQAAQSGALAGSRMAQSDWADREYEAIP